MAHPQKSRKVEAIKIHHLVPGRRVKTPCREPPKLIAILSLFEKGNSLQQQLFVGAKRRQPEDFYLIWILTLC
jgi:hypothetical protein